MGRGGHKLRSVLLRIILLIAVVFVIVSLVQLFTQIEESQRQLDALDAQLGQQKNALVHVQQQLADPDRARLEAAREQGYLFPDETVVGVVPGND